MLYTWEEIRDFYRLDEVPSEPLTPHYNVPPTAMVPIARENRDRGVREGVLARWGLIPAWTKDPTAFNFATFNARGEELAGKPMFRGAWSAGRRCILPASGYYEWPKRDDKAKVPVYITRADGKPLHFAGLWEEREQKPSATIITTAPREGSDMLTLHHRVPVILEPEQIDAWLSGETKAKDAQAMLTPPADGVLQWWTVSTRVNKPGQKDASLIERVA